MKTKISDLENKIVQIETKVDEKKRTQVSEYKRILGNMEMKKKKLKEKIDSYKNTTVEKGDLFKKDVSRSFKNLESQFNALTEEVNKPDKTILKKED